MKMVVTLRWVLWESSGLSGLLVGLILSRPVCLRVARAVPSPGLEICSEWMQIEEKCERIPPNRRGPKGEMLWCCPTGGFYGSCPFGCGINLYRWAISQPSSMGTYGRNRRLKWSLLRLVTLRTLFGKPTRSFHALVMVPAHSHVLLIQSWV